MKLVAAKCPSCGADIEVNKDLENTICQYCGTTVLIKDAIQKLKVDLSGKIEVDGIKTNTKRIEEAKKHIKLEEYDLARKLLNEVLQNDHFNIEAECLWIKNAILKFNIKKENINYTTIREDNPDMWVYINEIIKSYDKLIKLDDEKEYKKYLEEYIPLIDYLKTEYNQLLSDEKKCKELSTNINNVISKYRYKEKIRDGMVSLLNYLFDVNINGKVVYGVPDSDGRDDYIIESIRLQRNGSLDVIYLYTMHLYPLNPTRYLIHQKTNTKIASMSDLENKVDEFVKQSKVKNLKKWRNKRLPLTTIIFERIEKLFYQIINTAISCIFPLIVRWICSYRSNWYIKRYGIESENVKSVLKVDNIIEIGCFVVIGVIIAFNLIKYIRNTDLE